MPRDAVSAAGLSRLRGRVVRMARPAHWSGLYTTAEAAVLLGVAEVTVRQWRYKRWLQPQGLDERGRPLHSAAALRAAEQTAREGGSRSASRADPRRIRGRKGAAKAVQPEGTS